MDEEKGEEREGAKWGFGPSHPGSVIHSECRGWSDVIAVKLAEFWTSHGQVRFTETLG